MAVERRSDFQCCMTHRRWVRGVRAKVNSGHGSGQQGVGVGHLPAPGILSPGTQLGPLSSQGPYQGKGCLGHRPGPWVLVLSWPQPLPPVPWCWDSGAHCGPVQPLVVDSATQLPSLAVLCAAGMPVVRGGQTVPGQAPLCFDPGSPASDKTEGKKKGRPKAENQALRDIPVSSLRAMVGLMLGSPCPATALP